MRIIRHTRSSLSASFGTFSLPGGGNRRAAAAPVNPVPPRRSKACLRKRTAQGAGRARTRVPELGIAEAHFERMVRPNSPAEMLKQVFEGKEGTAHKPLRPVEKHTALAGTEDVLWIEVHVSGGIGYVEFAEASESVFDRCAKLPPIEARRPFALRQTGILGHLAQRRKEGSHAREQRTEPEIASAFGWKFASGGKRQCLEAGEAFGGVLPVGGAESVRQGRATCGFG